MKSLASTVLSLALVSALVGLGFCAVLASKASYFQKFNFATFVFTETQAVNLNQCFLNWVR